MRLSHHLREDLVVHGLGAPDTASALNAFGALFEGAGLVSSGEEVARALQAREDAHTTCLGEGVAVPHATISELEKIVLLVAATSEPVPFGPPEADPVDLFFVLLSPSGKEGSHIKLLARICRLVRHPGVLDTLRSASAGDGLFQALLHVDSEHV
jgi:PTS system nitrogen regulatory IIA component